MMVGLFGNNGEGSDELTMPMQENKTIGLTFVDNLSGGQKVRLRQVTWTSKRRAREFAR